MTEVHVGIKQTIKLLLMLSFIIAPLASAKVSAADYNVNAKVNAPTANQPASIIRPSANETVKDSLIDVVGYCPVVNPRLIVMIWRDNVFAGSTVCDYDGTFRLSVKLNPGTNYLVPKLITITNNPGIDGAPVTVYYDNTSTNSEPSLAINEQTKEELPLEPSQLKEPQLKVEDQFLPISSDGEVLLKFEIKDGEPPYTLLVDWGDGNVERIYFDSPGEKTIKHKYDFGRYYIVKLTTTDKNGKTSQLVLGAVASASRPTAPTATNFSSGNQNSTPIFKSWQKTAPVILSAGVVTYAAVINLGHFGHLNLLRNVKIPKK